MNQVKGIWLSDEDLWPPGHEELYPDQIEPHPGFEDLHPGTAEPRPVIEEPRPRASVSPLPPVSAGHASAQPEPRAPGRISPVPAPPVPAPPVPEPMRALTGSSLAAPPPERPSGLERVLGALRATLPFVQKVLPLLDGQIGTAVSNVLGPPRPPVNLFPLENSLAELQTQHRELLGQIADQNTSLKKVEDQLQRVREATDRNTLEQQEMLDDLRSVGKKVNLVAAAALGLLAVSIVLNLLLFLHFERIIP